VITDLNPSVLTGDPDLLDRLVLNLIQNAIRHNQPGGWLSITTDTIDRASQYPVAQLRVENSGRPVPQDDIDTLFEPFRRGQDRTGQGVGLGLSIVKAIATAHGGTVKGVAHVTNGGLLVIVDLPVRNAVRPGIAT
jgi:signal transduction histidine kinase